MILLGTAILQKCGPRAAGCGHAGCGHVDRGLPAIILVDYQTDYKKTKNKKKEQLVTGDWSQSTCLSV